MPKSTTLRNWVSACWRDSPTFVHSCVQATVRSRLFQPQTLPQISDASQLPRHLRSQNCKWRMKVSESHSWDCLDAIATIDVAIDASATDLITTLEMLR